MWQKFDIMQSQFNAPFKVTTINETNSHIIHLYIILNTNRVFRGGSQTRTLLYTHACLSMTNIKIGNR